MRNLSLSLLAVACWFVLAGGARARATLTVQCTGEAPSPASTVGLGPQAPKETDSSPELYGVNVSNTAEEGESFQCSFFVPADYNNAGDPPEIRFMGLVPPGQACGVSACTAPNDLRWRVYWRTYLDGDSTAETEANNRDTQTEQLGGETCGGRHCFIDEVWTEFSAEITDEATNMSIGDLIVVRPERYDNTGDYTGEFYVWPIAEIDYPN